MERRWVGTKIDFDPLSFVNLKPAVGDLRLAREKLVKGPGEGNED